MLLAEPPLFRAPVAYVLRVFGPPRVEPGIPLRGASLRSLVGIAVKQCVTKETLGEVLGLKQAGLAAGFTPLLGNRAGAPRLIEQSDSLYSLVSDSIVSEFALLDDAERALTRSKSDVLGDAIDTTIRLLDSIAGPAFGGDANAKEYAFVYDREFSPTFEELANAQLLRVCTALASRWDEADEPADTSRTVSSLLGVYDRSITGAGVAPWPFLRNAAVVAAKGTDLDRDLVRNRLAIIAEEYGEVDSGVLSLLEHLCRVPTQATVLAPASSGSSSSDEEPRLITIPGRLVNHAGRPTLRLPTDWPRAKQFTTALDTLRALHPAPRHLRRRRDCQAGG